ncbi:hypothetical protein ACLB1N_11995 [Escherichia coli]
MKILLIEDNQRTQEWVTQGLSEAGYVIDAVSDGRDGLYLALKDDYALIIWILCFLVWMAGNYKR